MTQDDRPLSQWPIGLGPAPTHNLLVQAYALLGRRAPGTKQAVAVAAYLSGHYWWPNDLGDAIAAVMGGRANDPRNVIPDLERRGYITCHTRSDGRRETWSCRLTRAGEAVVAAYCAAQGIANPVVIAPERQAEARAVPPTAQADGLSTTGPTRGPVPSSWSGTVSRDVNVAASTYAFRFGKRDLWKIGHAQDLPHRLDEINEHVPYEVLGERRSIDREQSWPTQTEAYEMEQRVLDLLAPRRTVDERVQCTADELQAAWLAART